MNLVANLVAAGLPSFSVILETENLANAKLDDLLNSLISLVHQSVPMTAANEVLLLESGDTPPAILEQLIDRYPWIQVHSVPAECDYYRVKMLGAERATGEVIVYCDCDCYYEPQWLENLLQPFGQNPKIQVLAGETMTRDRGVYGTAMAMTYIFPQFTDRAELYETQQYFLNNIAFRRDCLLKIPIPSELPFFRGNCVMHAHYLRVAGHKIWQQPRSRALHPPPETLFYFMWRFMFIGHDLYWIDRHLRASAFKRSAANSAENFHPNADVNLGTNSGQIDPDLHNDRTSNQSQTQTQHQPKNPVTLQREIGGFFKRIQRMIQRKPLHLVYLPLALPIALLSVLFVLLGNIITRLRPYYLRRTYLRLLEN